MDLHGPAGRRRAGERLGWQHLLAQDGGHIGRCEQCHGTECKTDGCSPKVVVSYGTRRYTTPSRTTRTVSSSTPLSSRIAWQACLSPTRRKPRHSRRSLTTARRTPTRTPRTNPSAHPRELAHRQPTERAEVTATACWEGSSVTAIRPSLARLQHPSFHLPMLHRLCKAPTPTRQALATPPSTPPTHHGSRC
jgi:hypothetical protein